MRFRSPDGEERWSAVLAAADRLLVALDFDGTLAPIVEDPRRAVIHPLGAAALTALAAEVGTVAIITGRPVEQVLALGGLAEAGAEVDRAGGRLLVLGQYGNERWSSADPRVLSPDPPPALARFSADLPDLLREAGAAEAWVEEKGLAVAVHTRRCADPAATFDRLLPVLAAAAVAHGLKVEPGRMVVEVRAGGMDKGRALRGLVAERGASAVVFAGDDLGDLPAFEATGELARAGLPTLLVCSASGEETALVRLSDVVVEGPEGVVALLGEVAERIRSARG